MNEYKRREQPNRKKTGRQSNLFETPRKQVELEIVKTGDWHVVLAVFLLCLSSLCIFLTSFRFDMERDSAYYFYSNIGWFLLRTLAFAQLLLIPYLITFERWAMQCNLLADIVGIGTILLAGNGGFTPNLLQWGIVFIYFLQFIVVAFDFKKFKSTAHIYFSSDTILFAFIFLLLQWLNTAFTLHTLYVQERYTVFPTACLKRSLTFLIPGHHYVQKAGWSHVPFVSSSFDQVLANLFLGTALIIVFETIYFYFVCPRDSEHVPILLAMFALDKKKSESDSIQLEMMEVGVEETAIANEKKPIIDIDDVPLQKMNIEESQEESVVEEHTEKETAEESVVEEHAEKETVEESVVEEHAEKETAEESVVEEHAEKETVEEFVVEGHTEKEITTEEETVAKNHNLEEVDKQENPILSDSDVTQKVKTKRDFDYKNRRKKKRKNRKKQERHHAMMDPEIAELEELEKFARGEIVETVEREAEKQEVADAIANISNNIETSNKIIEEIDEPEALVETVATEKVAKKQDELETPEEITEKTGDSEVPEETAEEPLKPEVPEETAEEPDEPEVPEKTAEEPLELEVPEKLAEEQDELEVSEELAEETDELVVSVETVKNNVASEIENSPKNQDNLEHKDLLTCYREYGLNFASYMALDKGGKIFEAKQVNGYIPYRIVGKEAIVSGGPICSDEDLKTVLNEFETWCLEKKVSMTFVNVSEHQAKQMQELECTLVHCGAEPKFTLKNYKLRSAKQVEIQRNQIKKKYGLQIQEYRYYEKRDNELEMQLIALNDDWLDTRNSNNFTMYKRRQRNAFLSQTMDFDAGDNRRYYYALNDKKEIAGFIVFCPIPSRNGYSCEAGRKRMGQSKKMMELIMHEAFAELKVEGAEWASMGLMPDHTGYDKLNHRQQRWQDFIYRYYCDIYSCKDYMEAKPKYKPTSWEEMYLVTREFQDMKKDNK